MLGNHKVIGQYIDGLVGFSPPGHRGVCSSHSVYSRHAILAHGIPWVGVICRSRLRLRHIRARLEGEPSDLTPDRLEIVPSLFQIPASGACALLAGKCRVGHKNMCFPRICPPVWKHELSPRRSSDRLRLTRNLFTSIKAEVVPPWSQSTTLTESVHTLDDRT